MFIAAKTHSKHRTASGGFERMSLPKLGAVFASTALAISLCPTVAFAADQSATTDENSTLETAAYLSVGATFSGTITIGATSYACTYEVTGDATVQIGDGTNAAIDTSALGDLEIPASVTYGGESYAVTAIGAYAFDGASYLTSTGLASNSTVTSIGDYAYYGCYDLYSTDLDSNSTVTSIGAYAFSSCWSLEGDCVLGSQVTSIGAHAFAATYYNESYLLASDLSAITMGDHALDFWLGDEYRTIYVPSSWASTTSFTMGQHTYNVANGSLVIMYAPVLFDVSAAHTSDVGATVTFMSSLTGAASITDDSGTTVWTGSVSAGAPVTASITGVASDATTFTIKVAATYPSSATATWYNTVSGSAQATLSATSYDVTFNGNGADSGSMSGQTISYDTSTQLDANTYVKDGYTFIGWNTAADGSGTAYTDGATVSDLGDVVLYAQWSATSSTDTSALPKTGDTGTELPIALAVVFTGSLLAIGGWALRKKHTDTK
jgi:uncharacterized repeat protein (TIGR02543 family)/LPXTG-motif cell wall-anchored protein